MPLSTASEASEAEPDEFHAVSTTKGVLHDNEDHISGLAVGEGLCTDSSTDSAVLNDQSEISRTTRWLRQALDSSEVSALSPEAGPKPHAICNGQLYSE